VRKWWLGLVSGLLLVGGLASFVSAQSTEINLRFDGEGKVKLGESFEVGIDISSVQNTLGTDIKLVYETDKLELVEVVSGEIYPNFTNPESLIEVGGELFLSGVSNFTKGVVPNGELVKIKFQPIQSGKTEIEVVYDLMDTTATAVIPFEGDELNLLTQAPESLIIEIGGGSWWSRI
jgi:cohesin domain-containing protein